MAESIQFDPALRQLLLRKTGNLLGEVAAEGVGAEEIPVVVKLVDPSVPVDSLKIVARFDQIVTARVPLHQIVAVRCHSNVVSLKASLTSQADLTFSVPEIHASPETSNQVIGAKGFTGRGVLLGIVDGVIDIAHPCFRDEHGSRIAYIWDQRGGPQPESPQPYDYGREITREQINRALSQPDPEAIYATLNYDPADEDPGRKGTHATHVLGVMAANDGTHALSIPAANDRALRFPPGVAPEAEIVAITLKGHDVRLGDTLADSVAVGEAVHYFFNKAAMLGKAGVLNISFAMTCGPHDGTSLLEQAFDAILEEMPGRAIFMSAGNNFGTDLHSSGQMKQGEYVDLRWLVAPGEDEIARMDIWYAGSDRCEVELIDPTGQSLARVALADNSVVKKGERIIASIFHRQHDPNNGDNQIMIFLWPDAMLGTWVVRLHGESITSGTYHAWIERDDPMFQSRFVHDYAVQTSTTGNICNGHKTIAVGAYDAREPSHPLAPFSSAGPTRDNRQKPEIVAPGVGIWAACSSQPRENGPRAMNLLTIKSGTSMATPHLTGTAALMFQANLPGRLTIDQTRDILFKTARRAPLSEESELERLRYGAGRVDAAAAVKAVLFMKQAEASSSQPVYPAAQVPALLAAVSEEYEEEERELEYPGIVCGADSPDAVSLEKESEDAMFISTSNSEQAQDAADFAWAGWDDASLRSWLAQILPGLLVEFGENELQRTDPYGTPVYDKSQPLVFGPKGNEYKLTAGQYSQQTANFVLNTAYRLGWDVPVYPQDSASAKEGNSYNNTAATFAALAGDPRGIEQDYFYRFFDIVARPGQHGFLPIQSGDILLRGPEHGAAFGLMAIIVDPTLRPMKDSFFASRDTLRGVGVQCIDAGLVIHRRDDHYGLQLTDEQGVVLPTRMVLRFKADAIDIPCVREQMVRNIYYRQMLQQASRQSEKVEQHRPGELHFGLGIDISEANEPSSIDMSIAVAPFTSPQQRALRRPILSAAENATNVKWNRDRHPSESKLSPEAIRRALASYVDFAEVEKAITEASIVKNETSQSAIDAVFVEAVHQFQMKCFIDEKAHDGKVGPEVLDSLGFVNPPRTGMKSVLKTHTEAQQCLAALEEQKKISEETAKNWFDHIVNPTFLGQTFDRGIHEVLAAKLRKVENELLQLHKGLTPAELGNKLGVSMPHHGGRTRGSSMDAFGLAVDINYEGNPWVAGDSTRGMGIANTYFIEAMRHAALLILGKKISFTPKFLRDLGILETIQDLPKGSEKYSSVTGYVYDQLKPLDETFRTYLGLAGNLKGIEQILSKRKEERTAGVFKLVSETEHAAAERWQETIKTDLKRMNGCREERKGEIKCRSNFEIDHKGCRDPLKGFLNLDRDLVISLRETAGLAWGAVDFGDASGDMMHFDCRVEGIGSRIAKIRTLSSGDKLPPKSVPDKHPYLRTLSGPQQSSSSEGQPDEQKRSEALFTHDEAVRQLSAYGIAIYSSGNCSDRNRSDCTSLEGVRQSTIDGIITFRKMSNCEITITAGTERGHNEKGDYTHYNGYKLDIRRTPEVTTYIQTYLKRIQDRKRGKWLDAQYIDPFGNIYADEVAPRPHWDITFKGRVKADAITRAEASTDNSSAFLGLNTFNNAIAYTLGEQQVAPAPGTDRYSGYDLKRGDQDSNRKYAGIIRSTSASLAQTEQLLYVKKLQRDLRELGFTLVGEPDGVFGRSTEWAVREFQIYAKMPFVAKEAQVAQATSPRYVDRLSRVANSASTRYTGPVSGVVNTATRAALRHWLAERWRCPVVIEAWDIDTKEKKLTLNKSNIWLHNEVTSKSPRMFARDFSGYYTLPPGYNADDAIVLGYHEDRYSPRWDGPCSIPPNHTWPESELLPEHLVGIPLANLNQEQRSTYKVVRAVSEVECYGFFDSINAYDNAFVSQGPCHWTLGIVPKDRKKPVDEGELPAYLSYLCQFDQAAFEQAVGFFGVRASNDWGDSGGKLLHSSSRKYTDWIATQQENGSFVRLPMQEAEGNYFKTWHWFYRFLMAGRTITGYRNRMWHMARMRLRDILSTPWGPGVPKVPDGRGGTHPTTIGDVYTSERAIGLILRWHVRSPGQVISKGHAGEGLRAAFTYAAIPTSVGNPSTWKDSQENALIRGIMTQVAQINKSGFTQTMTNVHNWPSWIADEHANPRRYALATDIGNLSVGRNSFHLDTSDLPLSPY